MLTFFTVMVITYSFNGEEVQSRLLYTDEMSCGNALLHVDTLLDPAMTLEMVQCERSGLISRSPRPKARPWGNE